MNPFPFASKLNAVWWSRLAYGLYFGALGCFLPYIVLYYRELGMSGGEIGVLGAILPLGGALLAPVWGILADRYSTHRLVLNAVLMLAAVAAILLTQVNSFWSFLPLTIILAIFLAPVIPLLDGYGITISERHGLPYGQLRLWGSVGFTVGVWVIGWLMGSTVTTLFIPAFAIALAFCSLSTLGFSSLHVQSAPWEWRRVASILRDPIMLTLLLTVYLLAWGMNAVFTYFAIYITELGGTVELVGIASAIGALSELPVMAFAGWWTRVLGSQRMLVFAIVVLAIRFFIYGLLPEAGWVLPFQLLHGVSVGLYILASVTLVHQRASSDLAATAQSLLASTFALGQITGTLLGGLLLERIGIFSMYHVMSFLMLIALLVFVGGLRWYSGMAKLAEVPVPLPTTSFSIPPTKEQ